MPSGCLHRLLYHRRVDGETSSSVTVSQVHAHKQMFQNIAAGKSKERRIVFSRNVSIEMHK